MLHSDEVGFQMKIPQNWSAINTSGSPVLPIPASHQAADNITQPEIKYFLTSGHTWSQAGITRISSLQRRSDTTQTQCLEEEKA